MAAETQEVFEENQRAASGNQAGWHQVGEESPAVSRLAWVVPAGRPSLSSLRAQLGPVGWLGRRGGVVRHSYLEGGMEEAALDRRRRPVYVEVAARRRFAVLVGEEGQG